MYLGSNPIYLSQIYVPYVWVYLQWWYLIYEEVVTLTFEVYTCKLSHLGAAGMAEMMAQSV